MNRIARNVDLRIQPLVLTPRIALYVANALTEFPTLLGAFPNFLFPHQGIAVQNS